MDANQICDLLDSDLITFIHNIIVLLKIAVPVILVFLGMLDLAKGVISSKEEEIKKGQQTFIKRLIAGILVFLVVTIVQLVMGLISKDDSSIWNCANQILNGTAGSTYVPTGVTGNENNNTTEEPNGGSSQQPSGTVPSQKPTGGLNTQKEKLPVTQQQTDESYKGEGRINNNNVPNDGYSTTTTTTTTTQSEGGGGGAD